MSLTDRQRRQLKGLAHQLKPVVTIGQQGLTDAVIKELGVALGDHELVKVRINAVDRAERSQMIEEICRKSGADKVQTIGHVAVFFLRNPKKPKIPLQ